jgi:hypothetical protein
VLRRLVAAQNLDTFEIAIVEQNDDFASEWDLSGSQSSASTVLRALTSGPHTDAIIIGSTHLRESRRCLLAVTADGQLFRPLVDSGFDASHPLAKLYTRFSFVAQAPRVSSLPHSNQDVLVSGPKVLGVASHQEVLARFACTACGVCRRSSGGFLLVTSTTAAALCTC